MTGIFNESNILINRQPVISTHNDIRMMTAMMIRFSLSLE